MTRLELMAIRSGYGFADVLHEVSLRVEQGEVVAVLGPNGAGKSTLLNTISGLIPLRAGDIRVDGHSIAREAAHRIVRAGVVQVPEGRRIFAELSVAENLLVGGYTTSGRADRDVIRDNVFDLFPVLAERSEQSAGTLSGGEQQMLAIGRALFARPRILMLDEPSMGLAPKLVSRIYETFPRIVADGTAILLIEQNAKKALDVSSRAYVLEQGKIALESASADLQGSPELAGLYLGGHAETEASIEAGTDAQPDAMLKGGGLSE